MNCDKKPYLTQAAAEEDLTRLKTKYRKNHKGGRSYKRLNAYHCRGCGLWHLGRANKLPANYKKPAPAPKAKPHSWAYIRKRAERIGKQIEHDRQKRIAAINRLIEAEKDVAAAEREMAEHARQIADQFTITRFDQGE
jgi:hypothetical protein